MSLYDTMINQFSCGCVMVGDVPTVTRCEDHGGYIVACHNQNVPERRYRNKGGDLNIWQGTLLHNLRRLKDQCFSFVFAYPELNILSPMSWLTHEAWRNTDMEMFRHLKRILKPGGYISFVVDPSVLHTVTYQASKVGLTIEIKGAVFDTFDPPASSTLAYTATDAKIHMLLYNEHRTKIPKSGSRILDISGLKLAHTMKRKKGNLLLVLAGHPLQFDTVRKRLEEF